MEFNSREIVYGMLTETLENGAFSQHVISDALNKYGPDRRERSFITRLYLGVLERLIYLDHILNSVSSVKTVKMKLPVLIILRMGLYQMIFMDSVPDHAAVNESLKLAQNHGFKGLKSFINGVLRAASAKLAEDKYYFEKDMPDNVRLSVPKWIFNEVEKGFGREAAEGFFLGALNGNKEVFFHINPLKAGKDEAVDVLQREGCSVKCYDEIRGIYCMEGFSSLTFLKAYKEGMIFIQNPGSAAAAFMALNTLKTEKPFVIDVCAAPGGKSVYLAERLPGARIISRDRSEEKIALIKENAERLGLSNIFPEVFDAREEDPENFQKADLVIADLPCSGLGIIGEKPDIKLRIKEKEISSLSQLQRDILRPCAGLLKNGGSLVFSTCTLTGAENAENSDWIEAELKLSKKDELKRLPSDGTDGFYIAVFEKNE